MYEIHCDKGGDIRAESIKGNTSLPVTFQCPICGAIYNTTDENNFTLPQDLRNQNFSQTEINSRRRAR